MSWLGNGRGRVPSTLPLCQDIIFPWIMCLCLVVCSSSRAVLFLWQELNLQLDNWGEGKKKQSEERHEMREAKTSPWYY